MLETVVKDRNVDGVDGVRNGMVWKGRSMMERDGKAWKVWKWCWNDVGASGMDLEKFYVTKRLDNYETYFISCLSISFHKYLGN